jgi:tungstate transport system substrate-binding protein
MRSARLLFVAASLAAFGLAVLACGSDHNGNTPTAARTEASQPAGEPTKGSGEVILATTTSFQDSGLLDEIVSMFEQKTGYRLKPVAVGSGQAIQQASRGDADIVLAHSPAAEQKMVANADGIERALVMHNDFILVGPRGDPAGVKGAPTVGDAMRAIATKGATFISRGDQSGTNTFELDLWKAVNLDPVGQPWYQETGQGMGATLQVADQKSAYTLSDRATWLAQQKNLGGLALLFEGQPALYNYYHLIVVNPAKHPNVNVDGARAFARFMLSDEVQRFIANFAVDKYGQALFTPDAGKPEPQ